jgi:Protein of unknown function (DUF2971)
MTLRVASAAALPKPSATHFYRYYKPRMDWLQQIILEHRLYLPTAASLNDPDEGRVLLAASSERDICRFLMQRFHRDNPHASLNDLVDKHLFMAQGVRGIGRQESLRQMSEGLYEIFKNNRVFSMSKRWDNKNMWAKYAADHTGVCFEFANAGIFAAAREVIYGASITLDIADPAQATAAYFFYKDPAWSNEEEVRFVGSRSSRDSVEILPSHLTRIILGKDMRDGDRIQIRGWAAARNPRLQVAQAAYDPLTKQLTLGS